MLINVIYLKLNRLAVRWLGMQLLLQIQSTVRIAEHDQNVFLVIML